MLALLLLHALVQPQSAGEWTSYGRDAGGTRYSPLTQISRENVSRLRVAWRYRTGDFAIGAHPTRFEATPLMVDGMLYVSTPFGRVIALDPETGDERWSYDPRIDLQGSYGDFANRGVSTWLDSSAAPNAPCRRRIFVAPIDARLIALDAATGRPCADFGTRGEVDLKVDLINAPFEPGEYEVTSPPAVIGDLVITGSAIGDNNRNDTPSGVVRAYDARTGRRRWAWDPIPRRAGVRGRETWRGTSGNRTGGANAWSVLSVDVQRGLVFVPTGSASPDFYGGERLGDNLYANSTVALRAATGEVAWHFQAVHHDLWDYDVPAQPVLATIRRGGVPVDVVVQVTKMGHVFVLDRDTGRPVFPVEERAVPASDVPGEEASRTQPFPHDALRLVPSSLTAQNAWGATPDDREWCRATIASLRSEGIFTPPSLRGTVLFPGNTGGSNWGGAAFDPSRGLLITPTNRTTTMVRLVPRAAWDSVENNSPGWQTTPQRGTPYGMMRRSLVAPSGLPCNPPPWGTLTAVDLHTGTVRWEVPLGFLPEAATAVQGKTWGAINLGGAMITAGGLVFAAGTPDRRLRAFDVETGRELWSDSLPVPANAMAMTYQTQTGRQFLVIAAGGRGGPRWPSADHVIAYALPGPGDAPPPPPIAPWGRYQGEMIVEQNRLVTTLDLRPATGDSVSGELRIVTPALTARVLGVRQGNQVRFEAPFELVQRRCTGTIAAAGEIANQGQLFVGELLITGPCSEEAPDPGTFAVRRRLSH